MVGATHYKAEKGKVQVKDEPVLPWVDVFTTFYVDFLDILDRECETTDPPVVWKLLGDEILFYKRLEDHHQCGVYVNAMLRTIRQYHEKLRDEKPSLGLKCCAWLAGFPVNNLIYPLSEADEAKCLVDEATGIPFSRDPQKLDFIGPQIDTGFRLAKLASEGRMPVSVDLAYLLLLSGMSKKKLHLHYGEIATLKGTGEYPFLWIEAVEDTRSVAESRIIKASRLDDETARKFCKDYMKKSTRRHEHIPFIATDSCLDKKPSGYKSLLKKAQERMKDIFRQYHDPDEGQRRISTKHELDTTVKRVKAPKD